MKYEVGDKLRLYADTFLYIESGYQPYNIFIYDCSFRDVLGEHFHVSLSSSKLDELLKNGWTYEPATLNPLSRETIMRVEKKINEFESTGVNPFFDDSESCTHMNIEEKPLFNSWYKVCKDCKKEIT
jgi:hypothetical protein